VLVAVAGATGSVGAPTCEALRSAGHEVRALSRRSPEFPVDLRSGEGLAEALAGCDALVDATNGGPAEKDARAVLIEGGRRLLEAAGGAGVGHHLCLSIVGIERVPLAYYRVKVEQAQLVAGSGLPYTILRATQFHTLIDQLLTSAARYRLLPGPSVLLQPCDPAEVAKTVPALLAVGPRDGRVTVAGPEVSELRELAAQWRSARARRAAIVPLPLPRRLGRPLRSGALTDPSPDHRTRRTFRDWLRGSG
jgi:uncharacterized protein YbjT (DUF2867 family)